MTIKVKLLLLIAALSCSNACWSNAAGNSSSNTNITVNADASPATSNADPGSASAGGGESQDAAAHDLVADLYAQHAAKKSPFFQTKNRGLLDKYFTKDLADLIWKDAVESKGEVGAIDFDPLYNTQDAEIKNVNVGTGNVKGDTATVPVNFTNYGEKITVTFTLQRTASGWRIADIAYGSGNSLMIILKQAYQADKTTNAADGNFEGTYKVGDTTCTVKPVKMAYEVRWAKGSGAEMFFSQDENTFVSNDDEDKANRFVFTNDTYGDGTFYRNDGKTFPVKRIK